MSTPVILLAEDQPNEALLLRRAFERSGLAHRLEVVCDGEEAISYLQGEGAFSDRVRYPLPTLLLLDLKMPKKNGFEVLHWLGTRDEFQEMPVVVLTASDIGTDVRKAYRTGATGYLVKPISLKGCVELVKTIYDFWLPKEPQGLKEASPPVASV